MANAKSRVKAPKSATNKKGRGNSKQSLTGAKNAPGTASTADNIVEMGRPNSIKPLTTHDKEQFLFQNGLVIKDKIAIEATTKRQYKKSPKKSPKSHETRKITAQIVTKSGRIRKKSKCKLKLIDNILKSELMIGSTIQNSVVKPSVQTVNNNNDVGISNQNSTNKTSSKSAKTYDKNLPGSSSKNSPGIVDDSMISLEINTHKTPSKLVEGDDQKQENVAKKTSQSASSSNNRLISDKRKGKLKPKTANKINKVNDKTPTKTKQVTLSNGLVLTLTLFQCDYCKKMFSSKSSLRRHIYVHIDLKPHGCKKCSKKFRYKMHLQNHINKHHSETNNLEALVCHICDKTFTLEENLTLHLASHVKNENQYKCIHCEKKFSYHLLLIQHEKQHLVTGRYQCTICNMSYDCRNRLSLHVKTHSKIKDYICQYCGKEFLRMNSMRRHVQICHGGHRIQCPICMKKLKGHLTEHMRTHKQARPHECEQCGQRFTQSTQLTVHRRSHSGARPYNCRICDQPFKHSNALMLHIRRHTGEKPFPCAMCPMFFSQTPHMKAHMRKIHGKVDPYKCPKCDLFFKLKSQVESHAKACTVGERELTFEEKIQASVQYEEVEVESIMSLSRMRFLLALLLTMIASKEKLKFLGFNKRLIDDLLMESLEGMGIQPCKAESLTPVNRLRTNIQLLLNGTVPREQMEKFRKENKSTEELLELLTDAKKKDE